MIQGVDLPADLPILNSFMFHALLHRRSFCITYDRPEELTAKNNDEQVTSKGVLIWVRRIEAQRAQATILNNIAESCQFDKVKVTKKSK